MMTKLLFALLFTTAVWGAAVDPAKGLTLENKFVRLEFEPGGMGLAAMIDRAGGFNHIGPVEGKHLLGK
jgi:hypothetical protein